MIRHKRAIRNWEYRTIQVAPGEVDRALNHYGTDGWEAIHLVVDRYDNLTARLYRIVLRRRVVILRRAKRLGNQLQD